MVEPSCWQRPCKYTSVCGKHTYILSPHFCMSRLLNTLSNLCFLYKFYSIVVSPNIILHKILTSHYYLLITLFHNQFFNKILYNNKIIIYFISNRCILLYILLKYRIPFTFIWKEKLKVRKIHFKLQNQILTKQKYKIHFHK